MDASSQATTSTSMASSSSSSINIHVPSNLLVLPPAAALFGLFIGMSRGGTRARLRFLAENAHRQPKTMQGWYFYTKTRNYRVFFGALRSGARYASALGAAGALYVCVDEGVGWAREQVFHPELQMSPSASREAVDESSFIKKTSWRRGPVHWEDGAVAGALLATVGGVAYGLPNPLMLRTLIMGVLLGSTTSALQIARDKVASMREVEEAAAQQAEAAGTTGEGVADKVAEVVEATHDVAIAAKAEVAAAGQAVAAVLPPATSTGPAIKSSSSDSLRQAGESRQTWWSRLVGR